MYLRRWIAWSCSAIALTATFSCADDGGALNDLDKDDFDRQALLAHMADQLISPAYSQYQASCSDFNSKVLAFTQNPDATSLNQARASFQNAYVSWQEVSVFQFGPAEAQSLSNYSNVYPCDTSELLAAIDNPSQNLSLPSAFDIQGWPAADFLLFGLSEDVLGYFQSDPKYGHFLLKISARLLNLAVACADEWNGNYRNDFVNNDGYGATASFNKLANDFVFHFEKELRAGKIGIAAGVFSGSVLPNRLEAYYNDSLSKVLFLHNLAILEKVFTGESLNGSTSGPGLKAYLDELNVRREGELLSELILRQMAGARSLAEGLNASFAQQIEDDPIAMLTLYDALQIMIPWIKVDMLQAFNVNVDYIDADGD